MMVNDEIPKEVVEAAAKAIWDSYNVEVPAWGQVNPADRKETVGAVRAAYPHIAEQVLAAARKRVEALGPEDDRHPLVIIRDDALAAIGGQDTGEEVEPVGIPEQLPDHLRREHSCHRDCPCQTVTVTLTREEAGAVRRMIHPKAHALNGKARLHRPELDGAYLKVRAALEGDQ